MIGVLSFRLLETLLLALGREEVRLVVAAVRAHRLAVPAQLFEQEVSVVGFVKRGVALAVA